MNEIEKFKKEVDENVRKQGENALLKKATADFIATSIESNYSYNFSWMGRPIIQYPQDMVAMQEILWQVKPDLIIETGIAHGGSLIYYASILELIGKGEVLGIDIDIRQHNKSAIEEHPMFHRIKMLEGSSVSPDMAEQVKKHAAGKETILVCLDSNHTHEHVLQELNLYAPLVSLNSYMVVFDTVVEDLPSGLVPENRPWGVSDNPKTAVYEFLKNNSNFEIDTTINNKLLISVAPDGYLKRII
jgi:cephalosporin hydroxylase